MIMDFNAGLRADYGLQLSEGPKAAWKQFKLTVCSYSIVLTNLVVKTFTFFTGVTPEFSIQFLNPSSTSCPITSGTLFNITRVTEKTLQLGEYSFDTLGADPGNYSFSVSFTNS
jgi:hypothetical protein